MTCGVGWVLRAVTGQPGARESVVDLAGAGRLSLSLSAFARLTFLMDSGPPLSNALRIYRLAGVCLSMNAFSRVLTVFLTLFHACGFGVIAIDCVCWDYGNFEYVNLSYDLTLL